MTHYLDRLQNATRKYWNKPALNNVGGISFTYGEMARSIERFHIIFEHAGISKGDKIALAARNGAKWGMAYLAVNTYEAVIVPILADFTPDNTCFLVDHSESVALFTNADKWEKMDAAKMPRLRMVIDVESWELLYCPDDQLRSEFDQVDSLFSSKYPEGFGPEDVNYPLDNLDKLSTINYTSGSTGNPKGVMLTYRNFSATIDFAQEHMPATDKDNMVSMLPMAHMYGLVIEFIYPLCNGVGIYWLAKAPTPSALMAAFAQVKPYLLVTVPLVMEKIFKSKVLPILEKPAVRFACKIPGLRCIIYRKVREGLLSAFGGNVREFIMGGAALNPEVEKWLHRIGFPYVVGYGMTEATPLLAYEGHEKYVMGSCGKAVADVRIDSPDPEHVAGEIQAKGDNICIGYFKNPEASACAFTDDGYLRTGDLGVMDRDGNIFIRGRSKNMILGPSGQNIYPEELEAFVNNQEYVIESVVLDRGGKIVALVYPDRDAMKAAGADPEKVGAAVRTGANRHLPSYSQISSVELMEQPFEKTPKLSIKRFLYK